MKISRKLLFFIPVAAGLLLFITMMNSKKAPNRPELAELERSVHVVEVRPITVIPTATGYGYVQPTETWDAIPEVGGRVVEIHPELKKGTFISKGDLLVRIDPKSYGLAESRGVASVMSIEAQIKELEQGRINNEKLLEIEKRALQLSRQEVERKRKLFDKGYISASDLDQEEKNLLAQQSSVDNLINTLELVPSQKKALLAQKESDVSSLSESRLDIEKTTIKAPFDCRISAVNIELNQYAPAGTTLLTAANISAVEIPVQLSPASFINLLSAPEGSISPPFRDGFDMDTVRKLIGLSAKVRLPLFNKKTEWEGKFMRTGDAMDISTGAIPVYVEVSNPYGQVIPGQRPPLVPNMYTEVELQGNPKENRFVLPFHAIHEGEVYLVDPENRLRKRKVEIEMVMGNLAVIRAGLEGKSQIVTTDLVPAVEGMLLSPIVDEELTARIDTLDASR